MADRSIDTAHVLRALIAASRRGVADARAVGPELSETDQAMLGYIVDNPGCRSVDIANDFLLNRSTVSRQLAGLIALGIVREITDGAGRGRPLELTPRGRVVYDDAIRALQRIVDVRLEGWTDEEIARFAHDLQRFNDSHVARS